MTERSAPDPDPGEVSVEVPWNRVETFVGKLTHDIRNGFNALELQVTLIGELSDDPEIKEEVKRVRQSLAELTRQLQAVRVATAKPTTHLFPYPAGDFVEDLRERFQRRHGEAAARVEWVAGAVLSAVNIDPEQTMAGVLELLDNALQLAAAGTPVRVETRQVDEGMAMSIHQRLAAAPDTAPQEWGLTPLHSSRRGAYGLGAFRARRVLEAQGGTLAYLYTEADGSLVTMVTLPLATEP